MNKDDTEAVNDHHDWSHCTMQKLIRDQIQITTKYEVYIILSALKNRLILQTGIFSTLWHPHKRFCPYGMVTARFKILSLVLIRDIYVIISRKFI